MEELGDCLNESLKNKSHANKFEITDDCAQFDFYVYSLVVGLLCALGIVGNILSFVVMLRDTTSGATSFILQALAVADTLVLLAAIPLYVLPNVKSYTGYLQSYYDLYMDIMPYLWPLYFIPYTGTIFLTVLVSLNRFEAVCRPFSSTKLWGGDKVRRHVFYIAVFSVLYNIPRFFEYQQEVECTDYNVSTKGFGTSKFGNNTIYRILYTNIMYFLVMHGGPLLSLAFLNVNLIKALKIQAKRRAEMKMAGYQQDITLVLVVVVFVFICCQTPTFIDHILWTALDGSSRVCGRWHYYYTALGDMMAITNSSVNFVIYVLTSPKFRQTLLDMYRGRGAVPGGGGGGSNHPRCSYCTRLTSLLAPAPSPSLSPSTPARGQAVTVHSLRTGETETILLCTRTSGVTGGGGDEPPYSKTGVEEQGGFDTPPPRKFYTDAVANHCVTSKV